MHIYNMARPRNRAPATARQRADPMLAGLNILSDAATAIQNTANAERRGLNEAEVQAIDALFAQFQRVEAEIDNPGAMPIPNDPSRQPMGRRTDPDDLVGSGGRPAAGRGYDAIGYDPPAGSFPDSQRSIRPGEVRNYAAMFPQDRLDRGGFRNLQNFMSTVFEGRHDPRLIQAATVFREGAGGDGGFLVPTQFLSDFMDASLESEIVRPRATVVPMASNAVEAPFWSYEDRSTGIAGFTSVWTAEGATMTPQLGSVSQVSMRASKLSVFTKATNELVMDAPTFERGLSAALTNAVSFELDVAFMSGTGAGQPKGVLNDDALITVGKESGQTADTIVYANLINMFARMHPAGLPRSVWVANATALPQLLSLSLPIGDGGTHIPILRETGDGFSLLTRPLLISEKVPVVGDAGDIGLYDFSQYLTGFRQYATVAVSNEKYFDTDEKAFRVTLRSDGRGGWTGPATPRNGSTLSWAVTLAARG